MAGLAECAEQCIYKKVKIGEFFDVAKVMIIDRKILSKLAIKLKYQK